MALDLRLICTNEINVEIPVEITPDTTLDHLFNKAVKFYMRYKNWPQESQGFIVDSSLTYEFTTNIPTKIDSILDLSDPERKVVFSYSAPIAP